VVEAIWAGIAWPFEPLSKHTFLPLPPVSWRSAAAAVTSRGASPGSATRSVDAIDPEGPVGGIFHAVSLEEFSDAGPFDAVLSNLALHHIPNLRGALAKIRRLLRPGGRLIVNEHAWDRLDEPTARWYLEQRAAIDPHAPRSVDQCLDEWVADHAGLHSSAAMRKELDQRFEERLFVWTPCLSRELGNAVDERTAQALIDAGGIQATGFRYMGERP
jgi:SAM-dependent methyltransferase